MSNNFNDILTVLDTINKEVTVPVYIPSLNREVKFKSISTGQQKSLLKAAVDNPVFQTRFTIAFYNLVQENCIEKDILPHLTTIDSAAIAVQLRISTTGAEYVISQNGRKFKVNLASVVENFKAVKNINPDTVTEPPFTVQVGVPLFVEQYNIEKQLREKTVNDQQVMSAQLTETIGDAFIGEVSKFIKGIVVFYNNQEQQVDYSTLSYTKKHTLLEKMPSTVIKSVLKYMEKYVNTQKDILTISGIDTETDVTNNDLVLVIDSSLFIVS